jgi:thiol-disulfide isomerase/thioredoxin
MRTIRTTDMKRLLIVALLLAGLVSPSYAKNGYKLHLKISGVKDSMVFLAHYFGKPLPTIYKRDSARFDKNGNAEFSTTDSTFTGGIYMMLLSDRKTYFEFLMNSGDEITMTASMDKLPDGVKFKNSPENERFQGYVEFLKVYGAKQEDYKKQLADAKSASDTANVRKAAVESSKELIKYRKDYIAKYPGTLLANIFGALEVPQVPEGDHFLPDGKTKDSTFAYTYYKNHFWDGFNYQDDRLIHTPLLDGKLEEYMTKLVLPYPDSVEAECDRLLKRARGTKDLFKYTLWWLTRNAENSKVMGMDEVFVYLVEKYYMKGDAFWLTSEELDKYYDRARKIAPNVIGNVAPEVKLKNVLTKKEESMQGLKANWTLVIFYSPDCGHCQKELPAIDSVYEAVLKAKGCKVYTVATEGDEKKISEFLVKHKLDKWTNTWDPEHTGDWRNKFDVYSTPTIYILDDKKIIRGKRLDHTNIHSVIEMTERKAKDKLGKK